jgi:hypothetical protein
MPVDSCIPVIPSANLEKSLRSWVDGLGLSMDRAMRQDGRLVGCMVHNERLPHTVEVAGSNPAPPIAFPAIPQPTADFPRAAPLETERLVSR